MARWRRWVFEARAPADEFLHLVEEGLSARGVRLEPATHFDFQARAFGARAYVKVAWDEGGLAMTTKLKGGLFASPKALERMLLEVGRDAQARLLPRSPEGTV